jgi:glyceraldehyde 3-phosphate dehydrogenase
MSFFKCVVYDQTVWRRWPKWFHEKFGIRNAQMTTIHSYTTISSCWTCRTRFTSSSRRAHVDDSDLRLCSAKAVALVLPELKGKFDGISVRVPTPNVSLVDVGDDASRERDTAEEVNRAFKDAAHEELRGILAYSEEPLVSIDFRRNSHSSIVDAEYTQRLWWHDVERCCRGTTTSGVYSCRVPRPDQV